MQKRGQTNIARVETVRASSLQTPCPHHPHGLSRLLAFTPPHENTVNQRITYLFKDISLCCQPHGGIILSLYIICTRERSKMSRAQMFRDYIVMPKKRRRTRNGESGILPPYRMQRPGAPRHNIKEKSINSSISKFL